MARDKTRLLLAAGGTGGHIWPAIAFGAWIKRHHPECELSYVCGARPMELEMYSSAGISPLVLPVDGSPLSGRLAVKCGRAKQIFSAYKSAREEISRFRPDAALLFGGYLSFPLIAACKRSRVRCAMHEQNVRAGKVTRLAAKLGMEIYSGWRDCLPLSQKKYLYTGVPVRNFTRLSQRDAWQILGFQEEFPGGTIATVLTGSLGSGAIRDRITELASKKNFSGWTFVVPAVAEEARRVRENVWLLPKMWDPSALFAAADVLIVRAGGSTLTEAAVSGIPSLVIPWKGAADNHQYQNALSFVSESEGLIWSAEDGDDELESSLLRLGEICAAKKRGDGARGRTICENLWSALWSR
ncbi:UDP-N-acetylglucosamine--N-acetylmuramyl-(pentapeptide) pyrophosphoryl-undecaprenol N-acetylglucosamine transferase [Synergistes jonesii]|uniref:UDP-N-acetylglucosamine--N-acetylmuramyl- (pentapeptide) pyrophosphoryl-undecaprenol N-acetylglucosamine transferase n=1 Tax=Synergistes jonesii TaxID=2754 RepID=UPI00248D6C22|nr:UDP-N-acetylglucosamine--N-acetylmuramyl-(pentapeptide) pyrophosphoryl-undecaprenol N-acetylglucosamine transferase [Synergistes jonesii]